LTRLLAFACLIFGSFLYASAQVTSPEPSVPAKGSSIAGTVVAEPGSQPLKKVLVQIVAEDQKRGGNYTASSDVEGRFQVENVSPGRYRVFVEKTGFVGVNERGLKSDSNVLTVQAGQSVADLVFRMLATAVISGRITDEDGDAMSGVRVIALKKIPGKAKREPTGTEATNDLGEYRLSGLFPGQYWILAMPPPDFRDYEHGYEKEREKSAHESQDEAQPDTRYLATYYPGTYDAMQASSVTLKAGDEAPVNLTLVPARTYRVRGSVTGVSASLKPSVELVSKAGDSYHANEIGADGQFEVRGVGPGSYVLRVAAGSGTQSLRAHQDIKVVAADVDGVNLTPAPAFAISGHLHNDGGSGDLSQYVINLRLADMPEDAGFFMSQEFFGANASVDRLGNFEWKDVNPGTYIVQLEGGNGPGSFFLKSLTLGGRDIATGFAATGFASLDLVVSARGASIEGTVADREKDVDDAHAVADATVVAVPEEKYRKLPDHFKTGSTDQQGHFMIRGLAPGSYTLYAWLDVEDGIWRDGDFLRSQEANGTAVKVEEGSDLKVALKLSSVSEEWR
jgi:hypothetical protein